MNLIKQNFIFLRSSAFFIVAGFANLIFQFIAVRTLNSLDYGNFADNWSLIANIGLVFSGLQMVSASHLIKETGSSIQKKFYLFGMDRFTRTGLIIVFLTTILIIGFLKSTGEDQRSFFITLVILLSAPVTALDLIALGKIQGKLTPNVLQFWGMVLSISKIIILIVLTFFTHNLVLLLGLLILRQLFFGIYLNFKGNLIGHNDTSAFDSKIIKSLFHFGFFWIIFGFDINFYKKNADTQAFAYYAFTSNLSKIILTVSIFFFIYNFRSNHSQSNDLISSKKLINRIFLTTSITTFTCLLFLLAFEKSIFETSFGKSINYEESQTYFMFLSMLPISAFYGLLTSFFHKLNNITVRILIALSLFHLLILNFLNLSFWNFVIINIFFAIVYSIIILIQLLVTDKKFSE